MIKTVISAIYSALISIVLITIILTFWTGYTFFSQPIKSSEITYLIQDIYERQKSVIMDVVDLSKLLLKDTSEREVNENNNLLPGTELRTDLKGKSHVDESSILEDDGNNPLRIVIEPSLPEDKENRLREIIEEPLVDKKDELSINEMEMEIN